VAGGAWKQDARDVEGVEDLPLGVPSRRRGQEVGVQAGAVSNRLPATDEFRQLPKRRLGADRPLEVLLGDPGQPGHGLGQWTLRIDQPLHRRDRSFRREGDRADLDHAIAGRVETGGLEVEGYVLRQRWEDITGRLT